MSKASKQSYSVGNAEENAKLQVSLITADMDIDLQERLYPMVYDAALRILSGGEVSDDEKLCVRKWLENVEEYQLLVTPLEQDSRLEWAYGLGDRADLKEVVATRRKDDSRRSKARAFGLMIDVSEEELHALEVIDKANAPVPVTDRRVFSSYLRDYFEAKVKDRDSLYETCQRLCQSLRHYEKNDFRGMIIASIVRDYNYLENGPDEQMIERLRGSYGKLTDQTPMYANLVVNYCYELGLRPKVRDVMLLHTPSTYGLTKRKFEEAFPSAESELESLFSAIDAKKKGGIIGEAVEDAKNRNWRDSSRVFFLLYSWTLGKTWFAKLYDKRMYVWALQWPHGKIEETNKALYKKLKEFS